MKNLRHGLNHKNYSNIYLRKYRFFSGYSNKNKASGAKVCSEHPLQKKPAEL